ncbi:MAG: NfeD family protein [Amylibacter sp.]|nr:NfeD family protein [Amylibacter sp.]
MDLLSMLTGMSPWWWIIVAFALGSIEMATVTFFLIWPAMAALIMAGALYLAPNMSGVMQISLFAIFSLTLTFIGRFLMNRYGDGGEAENRTINNRAAQLIGQSAKVLEYDGGKGVVEIEGMRWRAQWAADHASKPGQSVRITQADAMVLYVENLA